MLILRLNGFYGKMAKEVRGEQKYLSGKKDTGLEKSTGHIKCKLLLKAGNQDTMLFQRNVMAGKAGGINSTGLDPNGKESTWL